MSTLTQRLVVVLVALICAPLLIAQQSAPAFEVASVRMTGPQRGSNSMTDARVDLIQPLRSVLLTAFRVEDYQLSMPGSSDDLWADIHATIPAGATVQQVPEMLRRLLAERLGLVAHSESRTIQAYQLIVGPGGIKMREVEEVTGNGLSTRLERVEETPTGAVPMPSTRVITSRSAYVRTPVGAGRAFIDATRMTMTDLAVILSRNLDEPVLDKTGLKGVYQLRIELPRDAMISRQARSLGLGGNTPPTGASAFEAVEGLGLKLAQRPTPVEVIVVDRISRTPTEN